MGVDISLRDFKNEWVYFSGSNESWPLKLSYSCHNKLESYLDNVIFFFGLEVSIVLKGK